MMVLLKTSTGIMKNYKSQYIIRNTGKEGLEWITVAPPFSASKEIQEFLLTETQHFTR
jgi:hypothetical protein